MYNRITLIGHLGADPELRYTPTGHPVCHFRVATSDKWTGTDGAVQERTLWWRVSVFGQLAEACHRYLKTGSRVYVEGHLTGDPDTGGPRVFTRSDGSVGAAFEVNVGHRDTLRFLSRRADGEADEATTSNPATIDEPL